MATAIKIRSRAKVISIGDLRPQTLPKSWYEAAGMFKHKKKALEAHMRRVRREWS